MVDNFFVNENEAKRSQSRKWRRGLLVDSNHKKDEGSIKMKMLDQQKNNNSVDVGGNKF
jgi:hypothetical protein